MPDGREVVLTPEAREIVREVLAPHVDGLDDPEASIAEFARRWTYFTAGCEAGFWIGDAVYADILDCRDFLELVRDAGVALGPALDAAVQAADDRFLAATDATPVPFIATVAPMPADWWRSRVPRVCKDEYLAAYVASWRARSGG